MVKVLYNGKVVVQVKRKAKSMSGVLKGLMIVFGALFVIMGIVLSRAFMLPGFLLVLLYFVYDVFSCKDYQYTLEGNIFTIDVIYGKRYRKTKHELDMNELEVVAPNRHEAVTKYRKKEGSIRLSKYDYTSYDDNIPYYTMITMEDGQKIKLLLDLNDELIQALKRLNPGKVFA